MQKLSLNYLKKCYSILSDVSKQKESVDVSIEALFNARVHLGHKVGSLNEKMKPYIYGERLGHLIIDLNHTSILLKQALNVISEISYNKGIVLFLCRNYQHIHTIEKAAKSCGAYSHCRFWSGGIFTNADMLFSTLDTQSQSKNSHHFRNTRLPDACIFFGSQNTLFLQHRAIRDSAKVNIPTIAILDTDSDPTNVTYPVPGNDDSPASIDLYVSLFSRAILKARK
ncbi:unnamed protein product [Gordionus sp. m RMFG-2023]|uniref:small ribosomal subunit protein uS2m-like n=1 Tax=Gordionus sp. m RMFG-2023 TaxID=3053472 RepID=UPI0030DF6128